MFPAILINQGSAGQTVALTTLDESCLSPSDVTIDVAYSTLNYKDALAITGKSPVVRKFPMVPGIDLAGTVRSSKHSGWRPGDEVVLNGWGVGETHWGGLAACASVKGDWLVPLPKAFTAWQAMAIGTAGYTASLCLEALLNFGLEPAHGEVLVTGATGGVGSMAIALLVGAGFTVAAATGKGAETEYLKQLGASTIVDRTELTRPGKPLQKERWAAAIDSLGSYTLANVAAQIRYGGAIAACGLAQGMDFPASVAPFILRGINLLGIDSVVAPATRRMAAWNRLARDLDPAIVDVIATEIALGDAIAAAQRIIAGEVRGRFVVDVRR